MIERNEIEKADRAQAKREALGVLAEMNAMLRKMPITVAVKDKRYSELEDKFVSLGWLGLCDEDTATVREDGFWTQLKLVDPDSDEASAIP